jgi:DNA-binding PucR family transcriptional regulator
VLAVEDHLVDLIVLRDAELAAALVDARLGVLDALPRAERDRLSETLAAWLAHQRHTPAVAEELHVHPQTVRYRVNRLRELLGPALESAQGRFELELALRVRASG